MGMLSEFLNTIANSPFIIAARNDERCSEAVLVRGPYLICPGIAAEGRTYQSECIPRLRGRVWLTLDPFRRPIDGPEIGRPTFGTPSEQRAPDIRRIASCYYAKATKTWKQR